jgi:phosphohistidine phosphatase
MRHADASFDAPADFDRPLSEKGLLQAASAAAQLASLYSPQQSLVSSSRRTQMTADIVEEQLSVPPPRQSDMRLYNASLGALLELVGEVDDSCSELLLIAHNPAVSRLVEHLCPDSFFGFPTGAFCLLEFDCRHWAQAIHSRGRLTTTFSPD